MKKITFQILSEYLEDDLIILSLKQINKPNCSIKYSFSNEFDFNQVDKFILGIDSIKDSLFNYLLKIPEKKKKEIIVYTKSNDILLASKLVRLGFSILFILPNELQKFKSFLSDSIDEIIVRQSKYLKNELNIDFEVFKDFLGSSEEIKHLLELAKKVTINNQVNALILGETGTGKGLLAKCIHEASLRRNKPYIDINCAAIPHHLLESELFGYEKGAFTDARSTKIGLMELAQEGTIFLDEIGDMSLEIQAKLLRAIDNKVIRRLGGTEDIPIKARIISATNQSLEILIEKNKFRKDLYHRLNVITLNIPSLRDRKDDIIYLAEQFAIKFCKIFGKSKIELTSEVREFMLNYTWSGNIRELRNSIERGILLADSNEFKLEQMFLDFKGISNKIEYEQPPNELVVKFGKHSLDEIAKIYAERVLEYLNGNKTKAAKYLDISRPRLDRLLK